MQVLKKKINKKNVIVAVSGGMDPIHIGHILLFQEAKKLGDQLVIILNNDNWLKAKKQHIFMPEKERKEILEALSCVDKVILTGHTKNTKNMSVCRELCKLRPHIFANGGDRHHHNIPEVAICKAIKCKMVFNIGKGGKIQSSSQLLDKNIKNIKLCRQAHLLSRKKIITFDLDGTLTKSKTALDKEMSSLLCQLLEKKIVGVLGGGSYFQFKNQLLAFLKCTKAQLKNLLILPVSGGSLYTYQSGRWVMVYEHTFTEKEKTKILTAFKKAFRGIGYISPQKTYGKVIEDRKSQITFSALGQKAPLDKKKEWNTKNDIRPKLRAALAKLLPDFEVRIGGITSVDITKKGIDKAYGIRQIMKLKALSRKDIVYVGDAFFKGGNDCAVKRTKVVTIAVADHEETKIFIRCLLLALK